MAHLGELFSNDAAILFEVSNAQMINNAAAKRMCFAFIE